MDLDESSGVVGSRLGIEVTGFVAQETVSVRYTTTGSTTVLLASLTANSKWSATGVGTIPVSVYGIHKIEAKGSRSQAVVITTFTVEPSMRLIPASTPAGGKSSASLRGFKKYETVTLTLLDEDEVLRTVRTSSTGSANATAGNAFEIPDSLEPGDYVVEAVGNLSNDPVTAVLTITEPLQSAGAASTRSRTPSPTIPTPTETPTPEPSPTSAPPEPTPTETATAEIEPTATAEPDPTAPVNGGEDAPEPNPEAEGTPPA
jgi:hypothetical protein